MQTNLSNFDLSVSLTSHVLLLLCNNRRSFKLFVCRKMNFDVVDITPSSLICIMNKRRPKNIHKQLNKLTCLSHW